MASFDMQEPICRLCSETILDNNFEVIDDLTKNILANFLLRMKLDDVSKYVMCNSCRQKLNAAVEFWSICLNTDNTIIPHMDSAGMSQLDLRKIYVMEKDNKQFMDISEDQKVCRLCMQLVRSHFRYILEEEKVIIQKLVPRMNMNIIKNPIVCNECFHSLNTHNSFRERCIQINEQIGQICNVPPTECQTNDTSSLGLSIKTENFDVESEINEIGMSLKIEPIDIKFEENEDKTVTSLRNVEFVDVKTMARDSPHMSEFKQKNSLNRHKCDTCDFKAKFKYLLLQHQVKHKDFSQVPIYKCDVCDFKTKYKRCLINHQLSHKDCSEVQVYKCDTCDFKAKYRRAMISHQLVHKEVKVYKCDTCDYSTKFKSNLTRHQVKHKDILEVPMYKCDVCDYITKVKDSLKRHQLKHQDFSEVAVYMCTTCDFRTKVKSTLMRHLLKHKDFSEVPAYKCDVCDYRTKVKGILIRHQLKHKEFSEVEVYTCDVCDFKTKYKNNLASHQLRHKT